MIFQYPRPSSSLIPLGWEHNHLTGQYHWDPAFASKLGRFRPLRGASWLREEQSAWGTVLSDEASGSART